MAENWRKLGKMEGCTRLNKNGVNPWGFRTCPKISRIYILTVLGLNLFANGNLVVAMRLQFFNVLLVDCLGLGLALHLFLAFRENKKMKFGDLKNLETGNPDF